MAVYCRACDTHSEVVYRCEECGADLTNAEKTTGREEV